METWCKLGKRSGGNAILLQLASGPLYVIMLAGTGKGTKGPHFLEIEVKRK